MKHFIYIILLAIMPMSIWAEEQDTLALNHPEYLPSIALGTEAPEIVAHDTLGVEVKLSEYRGKYVVLDFWATWCGDCRREVPMLKQLYMDEQLHSIKSDNDVQWLSVSFDYNETNWRKFLTTEQFPWPQVSNLLRPREDPTFKAYKPNWIPAFLVIDPQGMIVGKAITAKGLENELRKLKGSH